MVSYKNLVVVTCHGSFFTHAPYQPLIQELKARDIDAYCPQRPTCDLRKLNVGNDLNNPDFDRGHLEAIRTARKMLNQPGPPDSPRWACHRRLGSDGSCPAGASDEVLAHRRVIGIFYIASFIVPLGELVYSFLRPDDGVRLETPPFMKLHNYGDDTVVSAVGAAWYLFSGLDEVSARKWAATVTATPRMTARLTTDDYSALPCAYLVLEADRTLTQEYQEWMIAARDFTVYRAPTGHSPHLSWTTGLVEKLMEFANGILAS
ncbi:hypothetical protein BBP40_006121 [Aspergillus hancockii]|nr:hypothetical protein BBP40_006121 [Aspergillus hancockii]